jgi:hypothetical protein
MKAIESFVYIYYSMRIEVNLLVVLGRLNNGQALDSAALFGWDGDAQLHHSGLRFTYTNRSLRVQDPHAMFSNVVDWKDKLFATRLFDFTLLMSILSRFRCEMVKYLSRLFECPFRTQHFDLQAQNAHGAERRYTKMSTH